MENLINYKKFVTSQWGEDGIIEEIFRRMGARNKLGVEFGAGEGEFLSNIYNLLKNHNWGGLLIDGNPVYVKKWNDLAKNLQDVKILETFVEAEGRNSLDQILFSAGMPKDLDFLCIDIDGNDYYIFKSLKNYKPRLVLVEHNPTIPPDVDIVQKLNEEPAFGASALALLNLAHKKGYKLACVTETNSFFVVEEEFGKLGVNEPNLCEDFPKTAQARIISAYNGTMYLMSPQGEPSYTRIFSAYQSQVFKSSIHNISVGFAFSKKLSETLCQAGKPIKIFWDDPSRSGNFIKVFFMFLADLFKLKRKL